MGEGYPDDWNRRRREVFSRDDYTCQSCGREGGSGGDAELHAHHVVPMSKGGWHGMDNLTTVCDRCHAAFHGDSRLLSDQSRGGTSLSGHLAVALLTGWWTFGLGNLLYALGGGGASSGWGERRRRRKGVKRLKRKAKQRPGSASGDGHWYEKVDKGYNEEFDGCPTCGREGLSVRWESRGWLRKKRVKVIECQRCGSLFEERTTQRGLALSRVHSVSEIGAVESGLEYELEKHLRLGTIDPGELEELERNLLKEADSKEARRYAKSKFEKVKKRRARTTRPDNTASQTEGTGQESSERTTELSEEEYHRRLRRAVHGEDGPGHGESGGRETDRADRSAVHRIPRDTWRGAVARVLSRNRWMDAHDVSEAVTESSDIDRTLSAGGASSVLSDMHRHDDVVRRETSSGRVTYEYRLRDDAVIS